MQLTAVCRGEDKDHYGVGELTIRELERVRRSLTAGLGLTRPCSPARGPIESHLSAVTAELERRRYFETAYPAHPGQVRAARHDVADFLSGCPRADDATLIASELATNAVVHSASGNGGEFVLRAEFHPDFVWIEAEDAGGPWHPPHRAHDERGHGLDIINSFCGADGWGTQDLDTGRVVWARLALP